MLVNKENITQFIPQRAPFIMVDELAHADENGFTTQFKVENNNIFIEDNLLSESALTENIAQTCASGFGYLASLESDAEPKVGFIGAITRLKVTDLPKSNAQLTTKVEILTTFDAIHLVKGVVYENDKQLLECQMKIVLA